MADIHTDEVVTNENDRTNPATSHWNFTSFITVHYPRQLHAAACQRMREEDDPTDETLDGHRIMMHELLGTADAPDIGACLIMLLDQGSLPGCSIDESSAVAAEVLDVDLGDEDQDPRGGSDEGEP